jgi:hypothetical protein
LQIEPQTIVRMDTDRQMNPACEATSPSVRILPTIHGPVTCTVTTDDAPPTFVAQTVATILSHPGSESTEGSCTPRQRQSQKAAIVELASGCISKSRVSPTSSDSFLDIIDVTTPSLSGGMPRDAVDRVHPVQLLNNNDNNNKSAIDWSRKATPPGQSLPQAKLIASSSLYRARSIGTLTRAFADTVRTPKRPVPANGARPGRSLPTTRRRPIPTTSTSCRPSTTNTIRLSTTGETSMVKSKSQPSFLTLPEPWARGTDEGIRAKTHNAAVATAGTNRKNTDDDRLKTIEGIEVVEEESYDDETLSEEEDEEEAATRQRIMDWVEQLEGLVFDKPPSPIIEDDAPPQTDTAIHIVYDGHIRYKVSVSRGHSSTDRK